MLYDCYDGLVNSKSNRSVLKRELFDQSTVKLINFEKLISNFSTKEEKDWFKNLLSFFYFFILLIINFKRELLII